MYVEADSKLLKAIHKAVDAGLQIDRKKFTVAIWLKFVFYVSISVVTYAALFYIENSALFLLCFVGYGFSVLLFAFNFAHDFSHGTIFKKPVWDNLGFIFIYTLNGAHGEAWKKRHVESHHFAPNVEHYDSDLEISSLIRVIPTAERKWFHRLQHLYAPLAYTTYSLYWVLIKDFYIFFEEKKKSPRYVASFFTQKVFYFTYLLALPMLLAGQSWLIVAVGFLVMHLCQSLFLLFTFFMTHHVEGLEYPTVDSTGFIKTSWVMNQIKSSNDMYPFSRVANFVFGGFNNHIAHHLFPNIHHIHYPQLNEILYRELIANGITPNQTSYWDGIRSHLRLLKKMGN